LDGSLAYVCLVHVIWESVGLQILDISDPAAPFELGSVNTTGAARHIQIDGNYAYVSDGNSGLQIINIADKTNPVIISNIPALGRVDYSIVADGYAYISDNKYRIFDVQNPYNPVELSQYDVYASASWVSNNRAYLAGNGEDDEEEGLLILDVADKYDPVLRGSYTQIRWGKSIAVKDNYAYYLSEDNDEMHIIDISDLSAPVIGKTIQTAGTGNNVVIEGDYCYISTENGVRVIDIADPLYPIDLGNYDLKYLNSKIDVRNQIIYVIADYGELHIVEMTDLRNSTPGPTPGSILGDVNADGSVTIVDALLTAQYYVGIELDGFIVEAADVDCDNGVDIIDALLIAQYYVGVITEFCL
jgi:hypothetical protein